MEFRLCCDLESLDMARSGVIWGGVWIEVDGNPFPEVRWNDMLVAFTSDLVEVIASIVPGAAHSGRIRFYDGPFWIMVDRSAPGKLVVRQGEGAGEKGQAHLPADAVVQGVRLAASALLDACRMRQWADNLDVVRLARALELLDRQNGRAV
ncbi:hypothetical protein ABT072_47035 [Streptomyces sp. NPDC002589]|uniref:hypothetical protein n=1 Tax=Streptomyces sp. NPDC002589 TaxID=3154420 RepID=UPI0033295692